MNHELTVKDIKKAVSLLEKYSTPAKKVKSIEQAREFNEISKLLGLEAGWEVGDEYYELQYWSDDENDVVWRPTR